MSWEVLFSDHVGQLLPRSIDWVGPATVSHLAAEVGEHPHSCLRSIDRIGFHCSSDTALAAIPVRRGERLTVDPDCCAGASETAAATAVEMRDTGAVCALLDVRSGPDSGRRFSVRLGSWSVGRGRAAAFRLNDPTVSRCAMRVVAQMSGNGPAFWIEPLGASVQLDGARLVSRHPLVHGSLIRLGATTLSVSVLECCLGDRASSVVGARPARRDRASAHVPIERSPSHAIFEPPLEVPLDAYPAATGTTSFPLLTVLIGVAMAIALLAITPAGPFAVLYLMGPLMLIGAWAEQRRSARRSHFRAVSTWRQRRDEVARQLRMSAAAEASALDFRFPTSNTWIHEVASRGPRVWECLPATGQPWAVRLGNGACLARSQALLPSTHGPAELHDEFRPLHDARYLPDAPVILDLSTHPHLAIVGPDSLDVAALARSILFQMAARIGPADAVFASCLSSAEVAQWSWLRWLPHTLAAESQLGVWPHVRPSEQERWWTSLERWHRRAHDRPNAQTTPRLILIASQLAHPSRARLFDLLASNHANPDRSHAALSLLWIGSDVTHVPSFVDSIIELGSHDDLDRVSGPSDVFALGAAAAPPSINPGPVRTIDPTEVGVPPTQVDDDSIRQSRTVKADRCALGVADLGAAVLAPTFDAEQPERSTSMPRSIPLDSVQLRSWSTPDELCRAWQSQTRPGLAAPIGTDANETIWVDLVADGPHGLIGGTTGSGKSALLQTWCLSLALEYSPARLNFLFIDYKGGAAFGGLERLPHCVGSITNLGPSEVIRTLDSLEAELTYRMRLLALHGIADIESYPTSRNAVDDSSTDQHVPLPRLVVVVDEFAALAHERPEFLHALVDLAARGRSLGIHLMLATQRPRGVISDDIRANVALRISLRVNDPEESIDIVGDPSAAALDSGCPGRAIIKTRSGNTHRVQVAHAHAEAISRDCAHVSVTPLHLWDDASATTGNDVSKPPSALRSRHSLAEHIVERCTAAHALNPITLRRPCAPPLPAGLLLDGLRQSWSADAAGLVDLPDQQRVEPFVWNPARDGHAIVIGPGRSGRSNALCALVAAVHFAGGEDGAASHSFWVIDPDGQLAPLSRLPRTAAYTEAASPLGVLRVLSQLEQRAAAPPDGQHHTLVVDNTPSLVASLGRHGIGALDQIERLATTPRSAGISVLLAADRKTAFPPRVWAAAETRVRMASPSADDLLAADVDGRLATTLTTAGQATIDGRHRMQFGHASADQIHLAATHLSQVPRVAKFEPPGLAAAAGPDSSAWGFETISLRPVEPGPSAPVFVVFGPAGSGKSSALCREAERSIANGAVILVWQRSLATRLREVVQRVLRSTDHHLRVLVDDAHRLDDAERRELTAAIGSADPVRVRWLISADSHRVHRFDESVRHWTRFRNGMLLQPTLDRDGDLFDVVLPSSAPCESTPGTGVLIVPNRTPTFAQVLLPRSPSVRPPGQSAATVISDDRSYQSDPGDHSPVRPVA